MTISIMIPPIEYYPIVELTVYGWFGLLVGFWTCAIELIVEFGKMFFLGEGCWIRVVWLVIC